MKKHTTQALRATTATLVALAISAQGTLFAFAQEAPPNGDAGGNFGQPSTGGTFGPSQGMQFGPQPGTQFGPQNGEGKFGPSQNGEGGQGQGMNGPSEEQIEKMQKQQEQQQEKMEAKRKEQMKREFARMKSGMKQFGSHVKRIEARIATLEKQGVSVPTELRDLIARGKSAFDIIMNGESMEDEAVQEAMSTMQEVGDELREAVQNLERLAQFPKIIKQAQAGIKRIETSLARSKKLASRSKVDASAAVSEFEQVVNAIKAGLETAKQQAAEGKVEEAMETLQNEIYEKMDDAMNFESMIRTLQNIGGQISQLTKFVNNAKRMLARSQKAGQETGEAASQIDEMSAKIAELKSLVSQKGVDPEELRSLVDGIFDLQHEISEELNINQQNAPQLGQPKTSEFKGFSVPDFSQFSAQSAERKQ